jgi:hypothetical protein
MIPDEIRTAITVLLEHDTTGAAQEVARWLEELPQAPRADSSEAPSWAGWWSVDPSGEAYWYTESQNFMKRLTIWAGIHRSQRASRLA